MLFMTMIFLQERRGALSGSCASRRTLDNVRLPLVRFLPALVVILCLPLAAAGQTPSTGNSDRGVVQWSCDFESSAPKPWESCGFVEQKFEAGQPRASIVSTHSRDGRKAVRLLTKTADSGVSNSNASVRNDLRL